MNRSSIAVGKTFPMVGSAAIAVATFTFFGCARSDVVREASCPAFAHVDRAALPTHLNDDPADDSFDAVWTRWSQRRPDLAWRERTTDAAIRLETTDGMVSHPARREVAARRSSQGWEVYARSSRLAGPAIAWSAWVPVKISASTASRLDTLLTDPCLWSAPQYLDGMVRLKNGALRLPSRWTNNIVRRDGRQPAMGRDAGLLDRRRPRDSKGRSSCRSLQDPGAFLGRDRPEWVDR
jgi:hypothetical protein